MCYTTAFSRPGCVNLGQVLQGSEYPQESLTSVCVCVLMCDVHFLYLDLV